MWIEAGESRVLRKTNADYSSRVEVLAYFVCSTKQEARENVENLCEFAKTIGLSISGVFFDKAGEPPHVLINLFDISRNMESPVILVPNVKCLSFCEISANAIIHYASTLGVKILLADRSGKAASIKSSSLRYLEHIGDYYGYDVADSHAFVHKTCFCGRIPFGYRMNGSVIEVAPRPSEAVKKIFGLFCERYGISEIIKRINDLFPDIKCPTRNQLYFILNNSRYIGCAESGLALPPIIENRLWLASRAEASRRGLNDKEHCFLLNRVHFAGAGLMEPVQYDRSLHAPAYLLIGGTKHICVDARQLENAVVACTQKMLDDDGAAIADSCRAASKKSHKLAADLENTVKKRDSLLAAYTVNTACISTRALVDGLDKIRIELKLLEITESHERYLLETVSKSESEIDGFFTHLCRLSDLCSEEKKYFLSIIVMDVVVSYDEICIRFFSNRIKRVNIPLCAKLIIQ